LTLKDGDGETISKNIVNWLTGIVAIATLLGGIFGLITGDEKYANQLAYIIALLIGVVSSAVFIFQRRRAARLKVADSAEPLSASAALRGLLPFEEGDELPGRGRDAQDIFTLVSSSSFRFGVLWGESGCGKTSLLRAGLIPKLRNEKFLPLYVGKPTNNPQGVIRSALLQEVSGLEKQTNQSLNHLLKSAAPKGKKFVVLIDQFEEFFLTNRTPKSRAGFIKWLGETIADENMPVVFLIGIRGDFFAQLQNFAPQIPEPTSIHTTYQLQNFDIEQAKQIFSAAAKADGIPFEQELIQAVIRELETEEFIRPAELQVVGTRLKRKSVITLNRYEILGGARGILSSYISDEIKQSPNDQTARLVLRLMCADTVETKSPTDLGLDDILHRISGTEAPSNRPEEIQAILNQFVTARVLIHTDDDKYNLAHDYLAPYVRTATEGTETNTERANRMLKRYVAEYREDRRTQIPFGRVRMIQRFASPEVVAKDKAQELIKRSRRAFYMLVATLVAPFIFLLGLYVFYLTNAYYFSTDNEYIALRAGSPGFTFLPGFHRVWIQTDFKRGNLKEASDIDNQKLTGYRFQSAEEGEYQLWGEKLALQLEPISQAQTWRLLGDPVRAGEILTTTITDPKADFTLRSNAIDALGLLAQTNTQANTSSMLQALVDIVTDPRVEPPVLRSEAINSLESLAQTKPREFTSSMLQELVDIVTDATEDSRLRSNVITALGSLVQVNAQAVTPDILQGLVDVVTDATEDSSRRFNAASALESLAQPNVQTITSDMLRDLVATIIDPTVGSDLRSKAASALGALARVNTEAVTSGMLQDLVDVVVDPTEDTSLRSEAASALESLAQVNAQAVTPDILQDLVDIVTDTTEDSSRRSNAVSALESLAQPNTQAVTSNMLQDLVDTVIDPTVDSGLHSDATGALESLAQVNTQVVTSDMMQGLVDIFTDTARDADLRSNAASALISLAQPNTQAVTSNMLQDLVDAATNPTEDADFRSNAAIVLGSVAQANGQEVNSNVLQALVDVVTDPTADYSLRYYVATILRSITQVNTQAVTSNVLQNLVDFVTNTMEEVSLRSEAAGALESLAQANGDAVTSNMLQGMVDVVTNTTEEASLRSEAAGTLESLAQANGKSVTSNVLQALVDVVTNTKEEASLRSEAAGTLESLAQANDEAVTSEMLQGLVDIATDPKEDSARRSNAAKALETLAQPNIQAVTSDMLQGLINVVTNTAEEASLRSDAVSAVGVLAQVSTQAVTSDMLQGLINVVTNTAEGAALRSEAASTLESIAQVNNQAVTSEMLQGLVDIATDAKEDSARRSNAARVLRSLAQVNDQAVTSNMLQGLVATIIDPTEDSILRPDATSALGVLARVNTQAVTWDMLQALMAIISNPQADSSLRDDVTSALGLLIEADPQTFTSGMIQPLLSLLNADQDSAGRQAAARLLFLISIRESSQQDLILTEFEELQASPKPHLRMTGSRALEMMAIGDLVEEARSNPERIERIKSTMNFWININPLGSHGEEHLQFAAKIALQEIEKIEAENK